MPSPRHKRAEQAPSAPVTTPDPSTPAPGPTAAPSVQPPIRELIGFATACIGGVGALVTLGALTNPLVSLLVLCIIVCAGGVALSVREV